MRKTLENTEHLTVRQAEVTEIMAEDGVVKGVKTYSGADISYKGSCFMYGNIS